MGVHAWTAWLEARSARCSGLALGLSCALVLTTACRIPTTSAQGSLQGEGADATDPGVAGGGLSGADTTAPSDVSPDGNNTAGPEQGSGPGDAGASQVPDADPPGGLDNTTTSTPTDVPPVGTGPNDASGSTQTGTTASGTATPANSTPSGSESSTTETTGTTPPPPPPSCRQGLDALPDPGLRQLVQDTLDKLPEGTALQDLRNLEREYDPSRIPVRDLRGLRCLTSLERLHLVRQNVGSLEELDWLAHLRELNLAGNPVSTSALNTLGQGLRRLEHLTIPMQFGDTGVEWLDRLPELVSLSVSGLGATDRLVREIALRSAELRLHSFSASHAKIFSLEPLKPLATRFTVMRLDDVPQSAVRHLSALSQLRELRVSRTEVVDLSWLPNTPTLIALSVRDNVHLTALRGIETLGELKALDLSRNAIEDVHPLAHLSNLEHLQLSHNPKLADIGPLRDLQRLKTLELVGCDLRDVSALVALVDSARSRVVRLDLRDNPGELCTHPSFLELRERDGFSLLSDCGARP